MRTKLSHTRWLVFAAFLLAGLQEANAWYSPSQQRWINRDPIGEAGGINLYLFVVNNPADLSDPFGLLVLLETHPVEGTGFNHAYLALVVGPDSKYYEDPRFNHTTGQGGLHYATLGAGPHFDPTTSGAVLTLKSDMNRESDLDRSKCNYSQRIKPPAGTTEDEFIESLLAADARYSDHEPYWFFPDRQGLQKNSNSYVSGLLESVTGRKPERPPLTPGFSRPVRSKRFK